jgi:hypothetical protein
MVSFKAKKYEESRKYGICKIECCGAENISLGFGFSSSSGPGYR